MAGLYPEEVISEVLSRTDIVDLVGSYVRLKRAGRGYMGLCPFHKEKSPSFHVSDDASDAESAETLSTLLWRRKTLILWTLLNILPTALA